MKYDTEYDIVILGSGPAGEKAAMQASKLRKKVLLIEKDPDKIGGSCLHTGTIPSKSLWETVVSLQRIKHQENGTTIAISKEITADQLMRHKKDVISQQERSYYRNLDKTNVTLLRGKASFVDTNTLSFTNYDHSKKVKITAKYFIIATGSRPFLPDWASFDQKQVFDSDSILQLQYIPKKLAIIGAGVIGCEYACIFAKLGIRVNLIARDYSILKFLDHEVADKLKELMRDSRVILRFGESVDLVEAIGERQVKVILASGKNLLCDAALIATGRLSNTDDLGLEKIGVKTGVNGLIEVNKETYQTSIPNIYAVGDVIGFPALASTAMLQARIATLHAFERLQDECLPDNLATGIWTIPPIGIVGKTEKELTEAQVPYEIGMAYFKEVARAKIMGTDSGILKLLFDPETLKLLGVHIIGPSAPELIHLGQAVIHYGGDITYFMNSVFNYPTLDQAYQVAAFNGVNRLTFDL